MIIDKTRAAESLMCLEDGTLRVLPDGWYCLNVRDITNKNFGLMIAYLLPGFLVIWGTSYHSETARNWLGSTPETQPTLGGCFFITAAALTAGLLVSTIRWAVVDRVHHRTGIPKPAWKFDQLHEKIAGFDLLVESHYRYYQFYGNMVVAIFLWLVALFSSGSGISPYHFFGILLVELLFWYASRDTLEKYFTRVTILLGQERGRASVSFYDGNDTAPGAIKKSQE